MTVVVTREAAAQMLGRIANTGLKLHLQAVCLRSYARARGIHRREISLDRPIFIVGCGRSGTTIFGRCLGQHEAVGYLKEPRLLWKAAFPRSDISSRFAPRVKGSLVLGEDDWNPANAKLLRFLFARELQSKRKTRLCEKTPGNEFRLELIARVSRTLDTSGSYARAVVSLDRYRDWLMLRDKVSDGTVSTTTNGISWRSSLANLLSIGNCLVPVGATSTAA